MTDFEIWLAFFAFLCAGLLLVALIDYNGSKRLLTFFKQGAGFGTTGDSSYAGFSIWIHLDPEQRARLKAADQAFAFQLPKDLRKLIRAKSISAFVRGYVFGFCKAVAGESLAGDELAHGLAQGLFVKHFGEQYGRELADKTRKEWQDGEARFCQGQLLGSRELGEHLRGARLPTGLLLGEFRST